MPKLVDGRFGAGLSRSSEEYATELLGRGWVMPSGRERSRALELGRCPICEPGRSLAPDALCGGRTVPAEEE